MSDYESKEMKIARRMAWRRAKGELESMKETYHGNENYKKFRDTLKEFVDLVEDEGLQE